MYTDPFELFRKAASEVEFDQPVSGGLRSVLSRGRGRRWNAAEDQALLDADPADLFDLARDFGISHAAAARRKKALENGIQRMMAGAG